MTTLINRLRETASKGVSVWGDLQMEAADRIEELEAQLAEANKMQSMLASVNKQLRTRLAEIEKQEAFAWLVCSVNADKSLSLEHSAAWEEAAHEHINDAITEYQIDGASEWVVRPCYIHPVAAPAQEQTLPVTDIHPDLASELRKAAESAAHKAKAEQWRSKV